MTPLFLSALLYAATRAIKLEPRIVNGVPIEASTYPWMVPLRYFITKTEYTLEEWWLIDPIVLTAAHCVEQGGARVRISIELIPWEKPENHTNRYNSPTYP